MKLVAALLLCGTLFGANAPRLLYSKSFPGSMPPFAAITLEKDGSCEYKEAVDDDRPLKFKLEDSEVAEMFAVTEKLGRFTRPLESGLKVANTGIKTFRYENGAEKNEIKFNYSQDPDARVLQDWFEKITQTAQLYFSLERAIKYDKLGVNKSVLQLEAAMDRKGVVGLALFLPLLDRIAKNETYLHMARERSARLAETIRTPK